MGEIKCWVSKDGTEETEEDYSRLWRIWLVTLTILWANAFLIHNVGIIIACKFADYEERRRRYVRIAYICYSINLALIVVWTIVFGSMLRYSDAG